MTNKIEIERDTITFFSKKSSDTVIMKADYRESLTHYANLREYHVYTNFDKSRPELKHFDSYDHSSPIISSWKVAIKLAEKLIVEHDESMTFF